MAAYKVWSCLAPVTAAALLGASPWVVAHGASNLPGLSWNPAGAASYLDAREVWWQGWPEAKRDHGTVCISCHTAVPYALSRSALGAALHESAPPAAEKVMLGNIELRVNRWSEMIPFYSDADYGAGKTAQSHATEAVMNAVVLASYDRRAGKLRPVTEAALHAAWALQQASGEDAGGWIWQDFHLAPWESNQSSYQGAAMLMLEAGTLPLIFERDPENKAHVASLAAYLQRHYEAQPLLNQVYVLWASAQAPGLLSEWQRQALLAKVRSLQQADGGWRLASLEAWDRHDKTAQPTTSDAYATALVLLATRASTAQPDRVAASRGVQWLAAHQEKDGKWRAYSLNKQRDPDSNVGLFMTDAATGYAALALEEAGKASKR